MSTPDRWAIIKVTHSKSDSPIYKVLGSWYGGYLDGDSWRINSGISNIIEAEDHFIFEGYSGSTYKCYKSSYGTSSLAAGIYENYKKQLEAQEGCFFEMLSEEEAKALKIEELK